MVLPPSGGGCDLFAKRNVGVARKSNRTREKTIQVNATRPGSSNTYVLLCGVTSNLMWNRSALARNGNAILNPFERTRRASMQH